MNLLIILFLNLPVTLLDLVKAIKQVKHFQTKNEKSLRLKLILRISYILIYKNKAPFC